MLLKPLWLTLFITVLVLTPFITNAQLEIKAGEAYLIDQKIKKVYVTADDQATWALTGEGHVYLKRVSDIDFSIYPHTRTLVVDDLTGFSEKDMYFSVARTKLLQVKNEAERYIVIPPAGFTHINNISVVLDGMKSGYLYGYMGIHYRDWIAIATNKEMFVLYRDEPEIDGIYPAENPPYLENPEWQIKHSDVKSVDFSLLYSIKYRCAEIDGDRLVFNTFGGTSFVSLIPQTNGYSPKINCTNLTLNRDYIYNTDFYLMMNFWGTDDGLYMKYWDCQYGYIRNILPNKIVNDIKQLDRLLPSLRNQGFIVAATETGVYYTPSSFYDVTYGDYAFETVNPVPVVGLENLKVKSLASNFSDFSFAIGQSYYPYITMCEKSMWAATDKGVHRMYVLYGNDNIAQQKFTAFYTNRTPDEDTETKSIYKLCSDEKVNIITKVPETFGKQLLVQWFKDGQEITDWIGKQSVDLKENGSYTIKVTALCENIASTSKELVVQVNPPPQISFNYPAEISLCENDFKELSTIERDGYTYKWFRDELEIQGATNSRYEASAEGNYRVEVSNNCIGNYLSSATVRIKRSVLATPVIFADKGRYCFGEEAILHIDNPEGNEVIWYKDGNELRDFKNENMITASSAGSYRALTRSTAGCEKQSLSYDLKIDPLPVVHVSVNPDKVLCFGENVRLVVNEIEGASYKWSTGETSSFINVHNSGLYDVTVTSASGCVAVSNKIEIKNYDKLVLAQAPDSKICTISGEQINLVAEAGFAHYYWNNVQGQNTLLVTKPGDYLLTVEDSNGCKANVTYKVIPWCEEIFVPNTFSPNGDGINDIWRVVGLEDDPAASVEIYNRHGSLMYKGRGSSAVWDGKINSSEAAIGVYYYIIKTKNSVKPVKGSLMVVR